MNLCNNYLNNTSTQLSHVIPDLVKDWDVQHAYLCPRNDQVLLHFKEGERRVKAKLDLVTSIEELLLSRDLSQCL